ncbi:MAG: c-type cytochrome biogenesis protein CcmI [Xanthobacteraceae bacterium]|nr:MAG: c-type cytochrome biogenesis protein CcmI [Xanthobacteraceae bacterium]
MTLWFILALMTVAAVFAVLWPLGRAPGAPREGSETAIYKDQLGEIERDLAAGLIGAGEAEAARTEVSRRLLAAADASPVAAAAPQRGLRRAVAVAALIGLPFVSGALYLKLGTPGLPAFPLAERAQAPAATESLDRLVMQVEARLEKNPNDGRGWEVLAPVLMRLGRYPDAIKALRNSIATNGPTATRHADLGEAILMGANGVVTAEAKAEFEHALALDADEIKARYFLGLAAEQDGRTREAAGIWRAMLAKAPDDAPWRPLLQRALARVEGVAAPSEEQIAAAGASDAERGEKVRGMVERLATRLRQDGSDVDGWLRLVRAYMVMGDRDKALASVKDARAALTQDAGRLRQLNEGLKGLGIDG